MFDCDEVILKKALVIYKERYGDGQMIIDKLDEIAQELKQQQEKDGKK